MIDNQPDANSTTKGNERELKIQKLQGDITTVGNVHLVMDAIAMDAISWMSLVM
ncbi:hypothetical protein F2Q70_00021890 [Brassica cretica]|uniref:Uncharacterized protein n=2 Tax=Brassica cretica TaxID=69181 RepID=A0A8S9HFG8_BRACR|nr:hypothetical protein F2Q70_00021890 [Brassica cretica]KAF2555427.1 hypothetical protein F2Q68_00015648 [Brassica cretica]KAF3608583.1 hypothetical protein DY000_02048248 [Brassica cretica]